MEHIPRSGADPGDLEQAIMRRFAELEDRVAAGESVPDDDYAFLADALQHGTREAVLNSLAEGRPLTHEEARLIISTVIALIEDDAAADVLERFMISGVGTPDQVRAALQPIYGENVNPELRLIVDWLGTHLVHAAHPLLPQGPHPLMTGATVHFPSSLAKDGIWKSIAYAVPAPLDQPEREALLDRLIDLVHAHGEPFRAYLRLPGVNAQSPALEGEFRTAYLTTVETPDELHDPALPVTIDAVDLNGRIHVFDVTGIGGGTA